MHLILATFAIALTIFAAAAPQPAGQRNSLAIPIYKRESAFLYADKSVDLYAIDSHLALVDAKIIGDYERNTGVKRPHAMERLEKRTNNMPLSILQNYWYGSVWVGNPARRFNVVFDTGSSFFFLLDTVCDTCMGHIWDPTLSLTSSDLEESFSIVYMDGTRIDGELYTDDVYMAGITVTNQVIGSVTSSPSRFNPSNFPADGVMGLALQTLSNDWDRSNSVLQTLFYQNDGIERVFSFKLSSPGAELYIGGSNSTLYTGSFTYFPVQNPNVWGVTIDNVQCNGQTFATNVNAIIDVAAFIVVGTARQVNTMFGRVRDGVPIAGAGRIDRWTFPCDSFPAVSLSFGGTSFEIPPAALNIGPESPGSSMCICGIYPASGSRGLWLIGHVFLQNVYTRFDVGNTQVGFAQLARLDGV